MYESWFKIGGNIILCCCPDAAKSCNLYHFSQYRGITPVVSRHTYETHFKICTKYESKRIIKKFKVLIAVGTKKVFESADYRFYTVLTNTEVSHPQSQGTHVEHTSGYVQSMDQKELSRNSRYWLLEVLRSSFKMQITGFIPFWVIQKVSHLKYQGTHVEHTPGYVQSMDQKELQTNSWYWLLEVQNNVMKVFSLMKSEHCYQDSIRPS